MIEHVEQRSHRVSWWCCARPHILEEEESRASSSWPKAVATARQSLPAEREVRVETGDRLVQRTWYVAHPTFDIVLLQMKKLPVGKVVYANAAGISMVFLNDFQVNEDLINTAGDKYADKPKMPMLNDLCNGKYMVGIHIVSSPTFPILFQLPFIGVDDAERVRRQRRIMMKALGPGAIPFHEPSIETSTQQLLLDLASKEATIEDSLLK